MSPDPNLKDYAERALWTAIETGLAIVIGTNLLNIDIDSLQTAGVSALSAGLTVISVYVRKKRVRSEEATGDDVV